MPAQQLAQGRDQINETVSGYQLSMLSPLKGLIKVSLGFKTSLHDPRRN